MLQYTYQTEIKISEENGKYLWIGHFVNCNHIRPLYRVVPQICGLKLNIQNFIRRTKLKFCLGHQKSKIGRHKILSVRCSHIPWCCWATYTWEDHHPIIDCRATVIDTTCRFQSKFSDGPLTKFKWFLNQWAVDRGKKNKGQRTSKSRPSINQNRTDGSQLPITLAPPPPPSPSVVADLYLNCDRGFTVNMHFYQTHVWLCKFKW